MNQLFLAGCRPVPLSHYLKSLGVMRLLSQQKDPDCRGFWSADVFVLQTKLEREELLHFLLHEYRPTPILAPWNGGSGFSIKDGKSRDTLLQLVDKGHARFLPVTEAVGILMNLLARLGLEEKPDKKEKFSLLVACRGVLPDECLEWLDAAYVLTAEKAKFPPLLGTGGNDGRLEFSNNFLQRILDVFDLESGEPTTHSELWLRGALFEDVIWGLQGGNPIGQFFPKAVGKFNGTTGFEANSNINPWDFILMLEGAMLFAASAVKRFQVGQEAMSAPFTVKSSSLGYGSAAEGEGSRAEMWVPLWKEPCSLAELSSLFTEGRVQIGRYSAARGLDFARAIASLGVDRGLSAFQRYGFQERNGLSYFAVPLGRFTVDRQQNVSMIAQCEQWLQSVRRKAEGLTPPIKRAFRQCEEAIFELCRSGSERTVLSTFLALGQLERALVGSLSKVKEEHLKPMPLLSQDWLLKAESSPELRLAASLASLYRMPSGLARKPFVSLREQLEPVSLGKKSATVWTDELARHELVWRDGRLVDSMNAILQRRLLRAQTAEGAQNLTKGMFAWRSDIIAFVEGRIDEQLMSALLWSCLLVDWQRAPGRSIFGEDCPSSRGEKPPLLYPLLKSCFSGYLFEASEATLSVRQPRNYERPDQDDHSAVIPLVPQIHRLAMVGDVERASTFAIRRLRASGFVPAFERFSLSGDMAKRVAAALLFPISPGDLQTWIQPVFRPFSKTKSNDHQESES